jgi:hypothetical protein
MSAFGGKADMMCSFVLLLVIQLGHERPVYDALHCLLEYAAYSVTLGKKAGAIITAGL